MAAALESPVSVMQTASEGGAWGIAVLARYLVAEHKDLAQFLNDSAFEASDAITIEPTEAEIESFRNYTERFKAGMELEHVAISSSTQIKIESGISSGQGFKYK